MTTYPDLQNKVVAISGAGGNLGMAAVRRLATEGVRFALIDINGEGLRSRLAEQNLAKEALIIGGVDLSKKADAERAIAEAVAHFGAVDVVLNIAGGFRMGDSQDEAAWDLLVNLNIKTALFLSGAAAAQMLKAGQGGRIVNVGARAALTGSAGLAAYSATKSAVLRLTESMAAEWLNHNITVNAIMPSVIDTPPNRTANPGADYSKWVSPESLADVLAFLSSAASRDISGALIPVYGKS
jgi:NAD(P)-dependent dehydrogenase (short-subunit alcohol dehydrogenase family)